MQGADITVKNDHKPLMKFLNGKMQITRLTDGVWNSPHTVSPLSGFQELKTKQLVVSHGY